MIRRFLFDDEAATAVEYAVMLGLIIATILGSVALVGGSNGDSWSDTDAQLQAYGF